jgi:hypothetical protein
MPDIAPSRADLQRVRFGRNGGVGFAAAILKVSMTVFEPIVDDGLFKPRVQFMQFLRSPLRCA